MEAVAVVLEEPQRLTLSRLPIAEPTDDDVVIDVAWTGVSTGTERLLWSGRMPSFPGMGYPLVPGYETVGRVSAAGPNAVVDVGQSVFVPGARCFGDVRGLFGGAASRLVTSGDRVVPIDDELGDRGVLLALAATAQHALEGSRADGPRLIVGHGVLGRLMARLATLTPGGAPTVWEVDPERARGADGYRVVHPDDDDRCDYSVIYDVSGDAALLDKLIARVAPRGEVVLAGFYEEPLSFAFPPAFIKEARLRVSAEWTPDDLIAVRDLIECGALQLDGLITHRTPAAAAGEAYQTAFADPACLKMVLDWSSVA